MSNFPRNFPCMARVKVGVMARVECKWALQDHSIVTLLLVDLGLYALYQHVFYVLGSLKQTIQLK